jgi:hypothetical protein
MNEILVNPEVPDRAVNIRDALGQIMHLVGQSPQLGKLLYTLLRMKYR